HGTKAVAPDDASNLACVLRASDLSLRSGRASARDFRVPNMRVRMLVFVHINGYDSVRAPTPMGTGALWRLLDASRPVPVALPGRHRSSSKMTTATVARSSVPQRLGPKRRR